jgi:acetate kinase
MNPDALILTLNGGSSSIKFAVYTAGDPPRLVGGGQIERVGKPGATVSCRGLGADVKDQPIAAGDHGAAGGELIDFVTGRLDGRRIAAVGHRVVHGGMKLTDHVLIDEQVLAELRKAVPLDSAHLPREISLIEMTGKKLPEVPQAACFDTAFFRDLPTVAKNLPIPRRYLDAGVRRFGFHGLSYSFLMQELHRLDPAAAGGRVVLAHLGSGASMAAVTGGKPVDTTMAFTPTAGLMMGTRCGDLDPGLIVYLLRTEKLSADQLDDWLNKQCGLAGVSGKSGDLRDLMQARATDPHSAEAVALFCQSAKKQLAAMAASMGGIDTLVFAGGIGEHSVNARAEICAGLEYLGIAIDPAANARHAAVVSVAGRQVTVRVMPTDEQVMIAGITMRLTHALGRGN